MTRLIIVMMMMNTMILISVDLGVRVRDKVCGLFTPCLSVCIRGVTVGKLAK